MINVLFSTNKISPLKQGYASGTQSGLIFESLKHFPGYVAFHHSLEKYVYICTAIQFSLNSPRVRIFHSNIRHDY